MVAAVSATDITVRYGNLLAVDRASIAVATGECFGIVGESGSGKSTLLRVLAGMEAPQGGTLQIDGALVPARRDKALRRAVQLVFQDPYGSLHPRHTVSRALSEPLAIHGVPDGDRRIDAALHAVGLDGSFRPRFPNQLSGGQRQRVAIARALLTEPRILLLDEPTSALDVSVQAEILNLLADLRRRLGLTYLFVSHDLGVVAHMCDRLVVMEQGRIVERLDQASLRRREAHHPYTRALVEAVEPRRAAAAQPAATPVLDVQDLRLTITTQDGPAAVLRGVDLAVGRERVGLVGESGSGKSLTGRAILGLLPPGSQLTATRFRFEGRDLLAMPAPERARLRGRRIGMVLQDPRFSLNPVMSIGAQIAEVFVQHRGTSPRQAASRTLDLLESVRIREPARVAALHPHEVSGGMGQRAMIAVMLAADPALLIADEATSALDVRTRLQILELLDELVRARSMALLLISHDLPLVQGFCDRVAVMYAGRVVETCAADRLAHATHPYTAGLLAALPRLDRVDARLPVLARDPAWAA